MMAAMTMKELAVLREKGVCCALPAVDPGWAESTSGLMKAMADPARLTMVAALWKAKSPVCICDFTADLGLAQATVSHHMARLRVAGLVDCEKQGIWTYYWLRRDLPPKTRRIVAQLILDA
jgi:ArsR family transcriptional regulator, arsenate/arsenite/antimonite-responsive transcriptional repressor